VAGSGLIDEKLPAWAVIEQRDNPPAQAKPYEDRRRTTRSNEALDERSTDAGASIAKKKATPERRPYLVQT